MWLLCNTIAVYKLYLFTCLSVCLSVMLVYHIKGTKCYVTQYVVEKTAYCYCCNKFAYCNSFYNLAYVPGNQITNVENTMQCIVANLQWENCSSAIYSALYSCVTLACPCRRLSQQFGIVALYHWCWPSSRINNLFIYFTCKILIAVLSVFMHLARTVVSCAAMCWHKEKPSFYVTSHPGQLSLAIPPRVGKMSTGDDYGHRQGLRNGEFCITVGPVTRTAGILTQSGSVSGGLGLYASLIGFNPRRLKVLKRGWAPMQRTYAKCSSPMCWRSVCVRG